MGPSAPGTVTIAPVTAQGLSQGVTFLLYQRWFEVGLERSVCRRVVLLHHRGRGLELPPLFSSYLATLCFESGNNDYEWWWPCPSHLAGGQCSPHFSCEKVKVIVSGRSYVF